MPDLRNLPRTTTGVPSVILDTVFEAVFHVLLVFALYLHFAGHNGPGGGFIAGLVAGAALTLRFMTGNPSYEARTWIPSQVLLGLGILLAAGMAVTSLILGNSLLEHHTWEFKDVWLLGKVKFTSSLFFDTGVFFVVVGVVATLIEVFGSERTEVSR